MVIVTPSALAGNVAALTSTGAAADAAAVAVAGVVGFAEAFGSVFAGLALAALVAGFPEVAPGEASLEQAATTRRPQQRRRFRIRGAASIS